MDSSNLLQVLSSFSQSPTSPFPFLGVTALILIYCVILYLVIDLSENNSIAPLSAEDSISGLSIEEIQKLLSFDSGANFTATCVVCLDGVQKGERCRMFPACKHVFHAHCIDLWLVRRVTCPTCRSPFRTKANLDVV